MALYLQIATILEKEKRMLMLYKSVRCEWWRCETVAAPKNDCIKIQQAKNASWILSCTTHKQMSSTFRFFSSIFSFGCRFVFLSTRIGVALCRSFSITEHIPFRTVSNMCGCLSIIKMYAPLLEMKIAIVKWQRIHFFLADLSNKFLDYFFFIHFELSKSIGCSPQYVYLE